MVGDDFPDGISQPDRIVEIGLDEALLRPTRRTLPSQHENDIAGSTVAQELGIEQIEHVSSQESRRPRDQPCRHAMISAFSPEP